MVFSTIILLAAPRALVPLLQNQLIAQYMGQLWEDYFSIYFKKKIKNYKMNTEQIIQSKKGTIVDVRTLAEFMGGNVVGSINIPLQEFQQRMDELNSLNKPLILCCASGNRSKQATQFLSQLGIDCFDGGTWLSVNYYQSQTI